MGEVKKWPESIPKWYFPRRLNVVILSFLCTTIAYMMRANLSIAIVAMSTELGWPESTKGMYLSAFFWGYITTQLLGGMAARRLGPKFMMGFVILAPSCFTLITPVVAHRSAAALVACRVLIGVAAGATFPSLYLILGQWTPFVERASALSFTLSGSNVGTILTDTIGPVVINHIGWQYVFYITGGIGFFWLVVWIFTITNSPTEMHNIHPLETKYILEPPKHTKSSVNDASYKVGVNESFPQGELGSPGMEERRPLLSSGSEPVVGNWEALSKLVTYRSFWVIVFDGLCVNWGYYIFLTWLPTYVTNELGFSLQAAGIIAITPNISSAIVGYISGGVCDRLIKRGYRLIVLRKSFFFFGCLMYAVTLVLLARMKHLGISPIGAAIILAIGTSGGGLHIPGYSANIFDIAPNHPSLVVGVSNTAATIPGIVGVFSTGLILSAGMGWAFIWYLTAGFYVVAMVANTIFADVKRIV